MPRLPFAKDAGAPHDHDNDYDPQRKDRLDVNTQGAEPDTGSRRRLLGRGVAAGLAGVAATSSGRTASATTPTDPASASTPTDPSSSTTPESSSPSSSEGTTATPTTEAPGAPTGDDAAALAGMLGAEIAARDLYRIALGAGLSEAQEAGNPNVFAVIADGHDAYADSIAGIVGIPAQSAGNQSLIDDRRADFESADVGAVADAAYLLESELLAAYTQLVGEARNVDAATLMASILVVEARHCAIMATLAGKGNDLVALLDNDVQPSPSLEEAGA